MIPPEYLNQIVTGDARVLAERIPDNSVDLIFTDPIYWQIDDYAWLAQMGARVLKSGGNCLAYCGNVQQVEAGAAMLPHLIPRPTLTTYLLPPYARLFDVEAHVNVMPLLWFSNGKGRANKWITLQHTASYHGKSWGHEWGKNATAVKHWLSVFSKTGDIVFDPFSGGATIPGVCKLIDRNYIAFEIDPATAERARARVAATQAMHPVFLEEQQPMELAS